MVEQIIKKAVSTWTEQHGISYPFENDIFVNFLETQIRKAVEEVRIKVTEMIISEEYIGGKEEKIEYYLKKEI